MDKVQKIREGIEKLKSQLLRGACSSQIAMETRCKEEAYNEVLAILDTMQEEPKAKFKVGDVIRMVNDDCGIGFQTIKKIYCDGYLTAEMLKIKFEEQGQWELAEEPTKKDYHERYKRIAQSEQFKKSYEGMSIGDVIPIEGEDSANIDFEKELYKQFGQIKDFTLGMQIAKRFYDMGMQQREPVSDDLEKAAEEYATSVDFAGNKTIVGNEVDAFKAGAKWQKLKDMGITNNAKGVVTNILNSSDKPLDTYATEVAFIMLPANLTENYHMTNRDRISDAVRLGAKWQKEKDESTTEDLGEYINELSKQFPEVSFAKLSRIAVRVAKWQMAQMIKEAKRLKKEGRNYE